MSKVVDGFKEVIMDLPRVAVVGLERKDEMSDDKVHVQIATPEMDWTDFGFIRPDEVKIMFIEHYNQINTINKGREEIEYFLSCNSDVIYDLKEFFSSLAPEVTRRKKNIQFLR